MAYWNPADKNAAITLSVSDTVATRDAPGGSQVSVRGIDSHATGKWYVEFLAGVTSETLVGICNATMSLSTYAGSDVNGVGYYTGSGLVYNGGSVSATGWTIGDVLSIAYDADAGNIWTRKNGTWFSGSDPAAGTGAQYTGLSLGTVYPSFSGFVTADSVVLRTASADFSYGIPSGFSAWGGAAIDTGLAWIKA